MTVLYLCPVNRQVPYGGVLVLYRHVDLLNSIGIEAKLVHGVRGFRSTWFENTTPIAYPPFEVTDADVLVVPEVLSPRLGAMAPGVPKISFNQNAYLTHEETPLSEAHGYRTCADLLGVMCVSDDSRRYLSRAFPELDVQRIFYSVGGDEFHPPAGAKQKRIAYMPRKRGGDLHAVLSILRARGALDGWRLVEIEGMTRRQVAETLRGSALFLSSSGHEGFGLPPVEALASGCFVIGYTGFGGAEYFDPRFTVAVPDSDVSAFARAVETWLSSWTPAASAAVGQAASRFVHERYSVEVERESVSEAFAHFRQKAPAPKGVRRTLRPEDTWTTEGRPRSTRSLAARQIAEGLIGLIRG